MGAATFLGAGVRKNRVEAYMWTSLAAAQGIEKARVNLAAIEIALTAEELERARAMVAQFRPNPIPKKRWFNPRELRLAFGPQNEYTRFFGFHPP